MAQSGRDLVERVRELVQDKAGTRWTDPEMLSWLNDGLLELVLYKPTAVTARRVLPLTQGTFQTLPSDTVQLIRITHNDGGNSIRVVDVDRLDAIAPAWRAMAQTRTVEHYMYDPLTPTGFEVYPPNDGRGRVSATLGVKPAPMIALTANVPVDDIYYPPLVDYLLYRAYSKHSKFAGNDQRAAAAYARFGQAVGIKLSAETGMNPNLTNKDPQMGIE